MLGLCGRLSPGRGFFVVLSYVASTHWTRRQISTVNPTAASSLRNSCPSPPLSTFAHFGEPIQSAREGEFSTWQKQKLDGLLVLETCERRFLAVGRASVVVFRVTQGGSAQSKIELDGRATCPLAPALGRPPPKKLLKKTRTLADTHTQNPTDGLPMPRNTSCLQCALPTRSISIEENFPIGA